MKVRYFDGGECEAVLENSCILVRTHNSLTGETIEESFSPVEVLLILLYTASDLKAIFYEEAVQILERAIPGFRVCRIDPGRFFESVIINAETQSVEVQAELEMTFLVPRLVPKRITVLFPEGAVDDIAFFFEHSREFRKNVERIAREMWDESRETLFSAFVVAMRLEYINLFNSGGGA